MEAEPAPAQPCKARELLAEPFPTAALTVLETLGNGRTAIAFAARVYL